jgi:hypothetical protein
MLICYRVAMFLVPKNRYAKREVSFWHCLVVSLAILSLTISLAGRTFDTNLQTHAAASSQAEKAKLQHRDKSGSQWTPVLNRMEPFYVAVCSDAVEPEQEPLLSPHVDDCLYNRPPPLS